MNLFIRYPAQYGHYETDAKTFAEWGIDSVKFDSCNEDPKRFDTLVPQMEKALNATGLKKFYFYYYLIDSEFFRQKNAI